MHIYRPTRRNGSSKKNARVSIRKCICTSRRQAILTNCQLVATYAYLQVRFTGAQYIFYSLSEINPCALFFIEY